MSPCRKSNFCLFLIFVFIVTIFYQTVDKSCGNVMFHTSVPQWPQATFHSQPVSLANSVCTINFLLAVCVMFLHLGWLFRFLCSVTSPQYHRNIKAGKANNPDQIGILASSSGQGGNWLEPAGPTSPWRPIFLICKLMFCLHDLYSFVSELWLGEDALSLTSCFSPAVQSPLTCPSQLPFHRNHSPLSILVAFMILLFIVWMPYLICY